MEKTGLRFKKSQIRSHNSTPIRKRMKKDAQEKTLCEFAEKHKICFFSSDGSYVWNQQPNNYFYPLTDLNALYKIEKKLTKDQKRIYIDFLAGQSAYEAEWSEEGYLAHTEYLFEWLTASSEKRAECLLKTLNLWKEQTDPFEELRKLKRQIDGVLSMEPWQIIKDPTITLPEDVACQLGDYEIRRRTK